MTNQNEKKFDLEERTAKFGERVLHFTRSLPPSSHLQPVILQLIRSATSIGANYCEADDAESRKDFKHKIGICKKESRETKHWMRMIISVLPDLEPEASALLQEAGELNLIFNAITRTLARNDIEQSAINHSSFVTVRN